MRKRVGLFLLAFLILSMPEFVKAGERVDKGGYWADKDTFVTEYTIPAVYVGGGEFVDVDGNTIWLNGEKEKPDGKYRKEKKYILYLSDCGTEDIEDDVVLAVE